MTDDRQTAAGIRQLFFLPICLASVSGKDGDIKAACEMAEDAIVAALTRARSEGREEALRQAVGIVSVRVTNFDPELGEAAEDAIRSLAEKEKNDGNKF